MPSPAPAGRAPLPRSAQGCEFHCRQHGRKSSACKSRSRAGGRCSITIASCFPDQAAAIRPRPRRSGRGLVAVISLTFQYPDSTPSPSPSPMNAAGLPASLRTAGIDSSCRVSPLSPRLPMHQLRAHLHQIRTSGFLASTFPVEPCPFPLEMRRIELEMPTFPLQTRNIQLEMRDIHLEICTFPHQHRAMHDMPAPFPSSPGRVGMEICEVGLETGKLDLQERELPLESGASYRQGCRLHLQEHESARQRHGLRRTGREFRRPRRSMRLQGHALRLQACAACPCRHRLRPPAHAACLQARRLDGRDRELQGFGCVSAPACGIPHRTGAIARTVPAQAWQQAPPDSHDLRTARHRNGSECGLPGQNRIGSVEKSRQIRQFPAGMSGNFTFSRTCP